MGLARAAGQEVAHEHVGGPAVVAPPPAGVGRRETPGCGQARLLPEPARLRLSVGPPAAAVLARGPERLLAHLRVPHAVEEVVQAPLERAGVGEVAPERHAPVAPRPPGPGAGDLGQPVGEDVHEHAGVRLAVPAEEGLPPVPGHGEVPGEPEQRGPVGARVAPGAGHAAPREPAPGRRPHRLAEVDVDVAGQGGGLPGEPPAGRATSERPRNHDHRGSRDSRERSSGPLQPCASA